MNDSSCLRKLFIEATGPFALFQCVLLVRAVVESLDITFFGCVGGKLGPIVSVSVHCYYHI